MDAQQKLFIAAEKGDKAMIRSLAFENVDFDARDDQDRTAFNIATQRGHHDAAKTILAAKQMKTMQAMGMTSPQFENVIRRFSDGKKASA